VTNCGIEALQVEHLIAKSKFPHSSPRQNLDGAAQNNVITLDNLDIAALIFRNHD
jgi:hypothetical protein